MFQIPTVLFVCTANLYRSRVAEALFNHQAQNEGLGWCAFSRGPTPEMTEMTGLAPHARQGLETRCSGLHHTAADKTPLQAEDLEMAHLIIALSQQEHEPMIASRFPDWTGQFNFWSVEDLPLSSVDEALSQIEDEVAALLTAIRQSADGDGNLLREASLPIHRHRNPTTIGTPYRQCCSEKQRNAALCHWLSCC